ncbi:MAG: hypothetical protein HGB05_19330 [Chloroflexi bacterium]|nr:hypothetical protein [Chloroflexota bacterium]
MAGHKGSFGHLLILAGSRGYHGAAVLAARAAQQARPGLITLGTAPEVYVPVAGQLQAVMVDDWSRALRKLEDITAVLAGPGLAASEVVPSHAVTSKLPNAINPRRSKLRFMRRQNSILRWRMMTLSARPMARSMVMSELPP